MPNLAMFVAATFVTAISTVSAQTTITIVAGKDTTLYEHPSGALANGAGTSMFVGMTGQPGIRRALLHFDVAATVPPGSRILSARLEVNVQSSPGSGPTATDVHRVTQTWTEGATVASGGQGGGGAAVAGDTTWLHADSPNTLWNNIGGDFVATPSFAFTMGTGGSFVTTPYPGLIADVQTWLDNPSGNHGWLLKGDESLVGSASKLSTRESSNSSQHPRLIVNYLSGAVGSWGTGCPTSAGILTLTPTGVPHGGAVISLNYTSAPAASLGATFLSLELSPVGTTLFPSCSVFLPLSGLIFASDAFVTSAGGTASPSITIPVGFPGYLIVCQGAVLDGTPVGFAMSNAGLLVTQ
jgi:hypothetical protein